MKLVFLEDYGNFNWADTNQYETYWKLVIKDDEGKTYKHNDAECVLEWREEGDQRGRWTMGDSITSMAKESFDYGNKFWVSSKDYQASTIAFMKVYNEHKDELITNWEAERKVRIQKEIDNLSHQLTHNEIEDTPIDFDWVVASKVKQLESWIKSCEDKLSQYKEGSELYEKEMKQIESYRQKLDLLKI